jgi:hypothetical protein
MRRNWFRLPRLLGMALCGSACIGLAFHTSIWAKEPPQPNETVAQAKEAEEAANTEWNSREMARSATREIARAERQKALAALDRYRSIQAACERASATAEADAAREQLQTAIAALREAADRLMSETNTANMASDDLYVAENGLRDKMCGTRAAEHAELERKAISAAEVNSAEAEAAKREALESAVLSAWENQQWAAIQRNTAHEQIEQSGEGARICREIAAVETDPQRKAQLEQFVEKSECVKSNALALVEEKGKDIDRLEAEIYPLRVAATGGLTPLAPECWDYAKARHLLVRAGFGGTPQDVERLCAMGLYKAVDHVLHFELQPYAATPFDATPLGPVDPLEGKLRNDFVRGQAAGTRASAERGQLSALRQWWLKRMVESPRPLQEKLTLFWHGHFATQDSVVQNSYATYRQNMLFREHAAGNFGGLLYGVVHDPVMLRYLDNNRNVKGQPNENLAREILELFSLGVDQGYTERDIVEAARALTGYTYDHATGSFRFDHGQHDTGDKTIFGQTGPWTGDDLVRLILEQPAAARFIAFKLHEYFAYRDPDAESVDRLAAVLRSNNYELKPMLRNLFLSEAFYSDRAMSTQIKCPVQLAVGAMRDLGVTQLASYDGVEIAIREMGQDLLEPPDVKGWRYGRTWISTGRLLSRYNLVAEFVERVPQPGASGIDVVSLVQAAGCASPGDIVDYLARSCLVAELSEEKRRELTASLATLPAATEWNERRDEVNQALRKVLILILCTPENQLT